MIQNLTVIRTIDRACRCCGKPAVTSLQPSKIAAHLCQTCADVVAMNWAQSIVVAHGIKEGKGN